MTDFILTFREETGLDLMSLVPDASDSQIEEFKTFYEEVKSLVRNDALEVTRTLLCEPSDADLTYPFNHVSILPHWNAYALKLGDDSPDDGCCLIGKTKLANVAWRQTVWQFFQFITEPEYELVLIDKEPGSGVTDIKVYQSVDHWKSLKLVSSKSYTVSLWKQLTSF